MPRILTERSVVSVTLLVLALGLMLSTFGLRFADLGGAFSPMFFPRIILSLLVVLAVLNVVSDIMAKPASKPFRLGTVVGTGFGFVIYVVLLPKIGFFFASVPLAMGILWVLEVRSWPALLGIAVGVPGALVLLFNHILTMPLPVSPVLWWL